MILADKVSGFAKQAKISCCFWCYLQIFGKDWCGLKSARWAFFALEGIILGGPTKASSSGNFFPICLKKPPLRGLRANFLKASIMPASSRSLNSSSLKMHCFARLSAWWGCRGISRAAIAVKSRSSGSGVSLLSGCLLGWSNKYSSSSPCISSQPSGLSFAHACQHLNEWVMHRPSHTILQRIGADQSCRSWWKTAMTTADLYAPASFDFGEWA